MADADTSTLGRAFIFASAATRARVVSTRLDLSSALRPAVHRPPAIDAPARFTTASAPTAAPPRSPVVGFHGTSNPSFPPPPPPLSRLTRRHTLSPSPTR